MINPTPGINATISLADDDELLALMREADFRFVFCGIESPDPRLLLRIHKEVNTRAPIGSERFCDREVAWAFREREGA